MSGLRAGLLAGLLALAAVPGLAHKPSDAYLWLQLLPGEPGRIEQRLDIAVRDLDRELDLDADGDGRITWGELRGRWAEVEAIAAAGVQLADGRCDVTSRATPQLDEHSDGPYAVLVQTLACTPTPRRLELRYTLFATSDPTHRGIVLVSGAPGDARPQVLGPDTPALGFELAAANAPASPAPSSWTGFVREGVHHILIGTDHVLFLLALLLPAVLLRTARRAAPVAAQGRASTRFGTRALALAATGGPARTSVAGDASRAVAVDWHPAPALRPALLKVLSIVTAFTLAHSLTLTLAALGLLDPPSRWVESLIAASVAFAAIDNLWPMLQRRRAALAFGFGLVHGFGFASVLRDIGLERGKLLVPLLSFNLGVEIGQLLIVGLFLPLAWTLRGSALYRRAVLPLGSLLILALALTWLIERAFDLRLLP